MNEETPVDGQVGDGMWIPPARNMRTGHRVSIGPYKPVSTRFLNWRWWLAEYPMRMLARHAAKAESVKEMQGEEYIGHHTEEGWPEAGGIAFPDPSWTRKEEDDKPDVTS